MKRTYIILTVLFGMALSTQAQTMDSSRNARPVAATKSQIVEASCGECNFGMQGTGCKLAVKIGGVPYLVEGAQKIDAYGDAHAEHGLCTTVRKAEVIGKVEDGKFVASSFKLLPVKN